MELMGAMGSKMVFIGCGAANMFAMLRMIKRGNIKGSEIIVIDRGLPPTMRERKTKEGLLFGFAGAGLWSDGKLIFNPNPDASNVRDEDRKDCHKDIKYILESFMGDEFEETPPSDYEVDGLNTIKSSIIHLGTDNNVEFGKRAYEYLLSRKVTFLWSYIVKSCDFDRNKVYCSRMDGGVLEVGYEYLSIGVGKAGDRLMKDLIATYNIKTGGGNVNIGGRLECVFTPKIERIIREYQYDYKFSRDYHNNITLRTFCVNNKSAYVIEEIITDNEKREVITFNGHAYGMDNKNKMNGLSNFGIIARIGGLDSVTVHNRLLHEFGSNGAYVVGGMTSHIMDKTSLKNRVQDMIKLDLHEYCAILNAAVGRDIKVSIAFLDFFERISKVIGFGEEYIMFVPEIKMSSGIISLERNFALTEGRYKNVRWVGDSCTGAVGIVPSAVTGIMATIDITSGI